MTTHMQDQLAKAMSMSTASAPKDAGAINDATAEKDLRYLCERASLTLNHDLGLQAINAGHEKIARVLPIAFNLIEQIKTIPSAKIDMNDPKMAVAVVCYANDKPVNAYILYSTLFKGKKKPVKFNKKTGEYIVTAKAIQHPKVQQYGFAQTIGQS